MVKVKGRLVFNKLRFPHGLYKEEIFFLFSPLVFITSCFHFKLSSNNDDSTSFSSDEDILKDMDQDDLLIFQMVGNDGFQHQ